mgnify:CR=1 FL=1
MPPRIRELGLADYAGVYAQMQAFNATRTPATGDEIWLVEHSPVFTQGQAGKAEHLLDPGEIPVIATDRGGQVTYHGPGQIVVYPLLDLKRLGIGPKSLVHGIEQVTIDWLAAQGIAAARRERAPGVYVGGRKIASLGIRIRRGCCYHGLSLNVAMDLAPFARINPCGYAGLAMTQLRDLGVERQPLAVGRELAAALGTRFARSDAAVMA